MKILASLAALAGLATLTALVAYFGFADVASAVSSVGWGAMLVVLVRAIELTGAGIGWWLLLISEAGRGPAIFVGLRFIREAINMFIPVAQVGGDLIGARLLMSSRIGGSLAFASVLIDIFVQVVTLVVFALIGFGIVLAEPDSVVMTDAAWGIIAATITILIAFFLVLNFGAFEPLVRRVSQTAEQRDWAMFHHVVGLGENLQRIWKNHRGLSGALLVHLAVWFLGAAEVWLALTFMGHPVSFATAIAIESLGHAGRAAGFAVPGGLGVQDGVLVAVSVVFGVPAEVAVAMALVKRVPDLVLGIPGLLAWQGWEGHRLFYRK